MNILLNDRLPIELEVSLCKILTEEANLIKNTKYLKSDLCEKMNCKIYSMFEMVANPITKSITENSLKAFMKDHKYFLLDTEISYVLERLDRDNDGRVTYIDFLDSVLTSKENEYRSVLEDRTTFTSPKIDLKEKYEKELNKKLKSDKKEIEHGEFKSFNHYPDTYYKEDIKSDEKFSIQPKDKHSESIMKIEDLEKIRKLHKQEETLREEIKTEEREHLIKEEEKKVTMIEDNFKTPGKHILKSPEYPTTGETPARELYEDSNITQVQIGLLSNFLNDQLLIDKDTEKTRERFNVDIKESFEFFTNNKRDSISILELKKGLSKLGIYKNNEEIIILMKRYDCDKDGALNYKEFESMILPQFKHILNENKSEFEFSLKEIMIKIIDNEKKIEKLKYDISNYSYEQSIYLEGIFDDLHKNNKEFLTASDVTC